MEAGRSERQRQDWERLKGLFQRAFDRSVAEQLLRQPDEVLDRMHDLVGEGAHFRTWRLRGEGARSAELPLVLKRAGLGWGTGPRGRQWRDSVAGLAAAGIPLVPPLVLLQARGAAGEAGDRIGLVMPFADSDWSAAAAHWQPMAAQMEVALRALQDRGLALGDIPQGGCWQGIPFLYDLSDLGVSSDRAGAG